MGEEEIVVALRAAADDLNGLGAEAGREKLAAIGFDEIDVKAGPDGRMAGCALSEKKHWVFLADGVRVVDLAEQVMCVEELRFEFGEDLFTDGVTAEADAWTDGSDKILRAGAESQTHASDAGFDDALDGSAPAGMKGGDSALLAIGDKDGDAVGGLNGEEEAGVRGHLSIGLVRMLAGDVGADGMNDAVGVELAERDERRFGIGCDGLGEETPVAKDGFAIDFAIGGSGEAEVQLARDGGQAQGGGQAGRVGDVGKTLGAVGPAEAALARAEPCPEPGKFPAGDWQPLDAVGGKAGNRLCWPEFVGREAFQLRGPVARVDAALVHEASLSETGFERRRGFHFLAESRGHRFSRF